MKSHLTLLAELERYLRVAKETATEIAGTCPGALKDGAYWTDQIGLLLVEVIDTRSAVEKKGARR